MKKLIRPEFPGFLLIILGTSFANAQFNRFGGGLAFNSLVQSPEAIEIGNPGFNLRGVYELNNKIFIIPSITFQVPKTKTYTGGEKKLTILGQVDADVTYTLATEKQLLFYALAGVNLSNFYEKWTADDPDLKNTFTPVAGFALGTGIEMIIENNINAFAQVKYFLSPKYQQLIISIGVHYYFKGRRHKTW